MDEARSTNKSFPSSDFSGTFPGSNTLLQVGLEIVGTHNLDSIIEILVQQAFNFTNAPYCALHLLNRQGTTRSVMFSSPHQNHDGQDTEQTKSITSLSVDPIYATEKISWQKIIQAIPLFKPLLLEELSTHPSISEKFGNLKMLGTFLGVPLYVNKQLYGRLYIARKPGGFTTEDLRNVVIITKAAGVSISNALLYEEAKTRENWLSVSRDITTILLEGPEEDKALETIATRLRVAAKADVAVLILPSVGNSWTAEIVDGDQDAKKILGLEFPPDGRAITSLQNGAGLIVDSMNAQRILRIPQIREYGPSLYAPLLVKREGIGVVLLLRKLGAEEFTNNDLKMAESVASQTAIALQLDKARHLEDLMNLSEERERIGRDLHDLVVQQLFASGMHIDRLREDLSTVSTNPKVLEVLEQAITTIDQSVRQIREIIHGLKRDRQSIVLVERLRQECSLARSTINFAPSILITLDGEIIDNHINPEKSSHLLREIDNRVGSARAADVAAVVRECLSNTARHAHAKSVTVTVTVKGYGEEGTITVTVTDDGVGPSINPTRHSGLSNLAARARQYRGEFTIQRGSSGIGTLVKWQAPLA